MLYKLPLHCVSSYLRGNNDAYDTNKMAEDFTHQFLDQAFSVGQQVQLQRWQLFSEIRAVDFFSYSYTLSHPKASKVALQKVLNILTGF